MLDFCFCHNIVDPFEDTERVPASAFTTKLPSSHNIVDPFEDTERVMSARASAG